MIKTTWKHEWGEPTRTGEAFSVTMGLPADMPDSEWQRLIHKDDLASVMMDWYAAYHRRRPVTMKFRMLDKWGEYRWIISVGCPNRSGSGYKGFFLIKKPIRALALN